MAVEKPEFRILIQPVPGIPEAKQVELCAKYQPAEVYVCRDAADFDAYLRQMRPPRVAVVAFTALLGEQRGKKLDRADNMAATKAALHKRGCHAIEATTGRRSDKSWPSMRPDGEKMCARLSQSAKNPINAKRGTASLAGFYSDTDLRDLMRIRESKKYPNWRTRRAAIVKLGIKPVPGRTWFVQHLETVARARGLLE